MQYKIYEKNNLNALHAICYSHERAQAWIDKMGDSGLFTDKTLNKDSFIIKASN